MLLAHKGYSYTTSLNMPRLRPCSCLHAAVWVLLLSAAVAARPEPSATRTRASTGRKKSHQATLRIDTVGKCDANVRSAVEKAFKEELKGKGATAIAIGNSRCRGARSSDRQSVTVGVVASCSLCRQPGSSHSSTCAAFDLPCLFQLQHQVQ